MQKAFILGNPRSGTSLLRLMLNSHPRIAAPPESGFLHWWNKKYGYWTESHSGDETEVLNFVNDLMTSRKIETLELNKEKLKKFIIQNKPRNYGELGSLIYKFWALSRNKNPDIILDKNNYYINLLHDLVNIWPDSRFVFLIRDGRDVACSYLELNELKSSSPYKPLLPISIEEIAREWQSNNQKIYDFVRALPGERWCMIRFEDLVMNPRTELQSIVAFLNIEFSDLMLDYFKMNDEPESTLDWKMKTLEQPDGSRIGRYKTELDDEDIRVFNKIANRMLHIGGYAR